MRHTTMMTSYLRTMLFRSLVVIWRILIPIAGVIVWLTAIALALLVWRVANR